MRDAGTSQGGDDESLVVETERLPGILDRLLEHYRVVAPVESEPGIHRFAPLERGADAALDYTTTLLPPKKALAPQVETLFKFKIAEDGKPEFDPVFDSQPQILVGVHPCDIAGVAMLDWAFEHPPSDQHYAVRRRATLIVGVDCLPDEHCFCSSLGTCQPRDGSFDLFLTPIAGGYLVRVGSERGAALLAEHFQTRAATDRDESSADQWRRQKRRAPQRLLDVEPSAAPLLLRSEVDSPVWQEVAAPCLSCGSCNIVCPTCYCFDIRDEAAINGRSGERQRVWDGCHLRIFTETAGGHNFRPKPHERLRHRFYRKYQYLMTNYGEAFCTGCGRCGRFCPVDINITETVNALVAASAAKGDGATVRESAAASGAVAGTGGSRGD